MRMDVMKFTINNVAQFEFMMLWMLVRLHRSSTRSFVLYSDCFVVETPLSLCRAHYPKSATIQVLRQFMRNLVRRRTD